MKERLIKEVEMLRQKYSSLEHGKEFDWVMIPDFALPGGWNRNQTQLLFLIPSTYPHTAPDNFYVEAGLRLGNGTPPGNYSEGGGVPVGGGWGCFSWHPEKWFPSDIAENGDNLLTFMKAVNIRLREGN